ncbi:MAG: SpoIIE family protein phosphatase [Lachnospiraceae bacterium]|nr:SpoIIE family protein phosphatase [Lachnospiraceae bacterium]
MFKGKQLIYSLIAAAVVTVLAGAGVLQRLDRWMQDALFQRPGVTSPDILIIGIDEEALTDLGPYQTWDRNVMASALEALASDPDKKPAVTAIDVLYAGETSGQADLRLAEAAGELGNVVTACMAEFGERITWENGLVSSYDTDAVIGFEQPYEALRRCTVQGHINAMSDVDGVVRHGLLYVDPEMNGADGHVPSMSWMAARLFLEQQEGEPQEADDAGASADGRFFYIPYTGRPGDFYDGVSLSRLIRGEIPPDYWAGKIVLIGPYATALQDAYFTPIDKGAQMFGVEIQANMIQSFLENTTRRELPQLPQLAVLFVLCAAAMMLFMNMSVLEASLLAGFLAAMGPVCSINLYNAGLVTHPLWAPVGVAVVYILAMAVHYMRTARERRALALEKERIAAELSLATRIQISALPKEFPKREKFHVYASMTPAKEVGGDFYDFFMMDEDHLGLVIADASGKGVPAALFMMVSSALIRNAAMGEYSPAKVLMTVNHQLCTRNPEEMFVTVWMGVLEVSTGRLTAANAGHEYPILKRPGKSFELFKDRHGLVLGAMDGVRYREYEIQMEPGTKLFVYTDGLSEATNASTVQFGTDRTIDALRGREDGSPEELVGAVLDAVEAFVAGAPQFDDLTMLCVEYH